MQALAHAAPDVPPAKYAELGIRPEQIAPYLQAPMEPMAAMLEHLHTTYGSIDNYLLTKAGLDETKLATLRSTLVEWQTYSTFGGTNDDRAYDVEQTNDGGFIIAGETESFGAGSIDVYLLKTDSNGTLMWSKTYGGSGWDAARSIQQTTDGGYIINGFSASFNAGDFDIYLIKTDANGNSGCNLGNPTTISDTAATITGSTGFSFSSGCLVTSPSTITSSGFPFTPLCFNTSVNEISTAISLHIYPNPFTNEFIINGTEEKGDATLTSSPALTGKSGQIHSGSSMKKETSLVY